MNDKRNPSCRSPGTAISAFRLTSQAKAVLIDPFFPGNPAFASDKAAAIQGRQADRAYPSAIGDHVGDTLDIRRRRRRDGHQPTTDLCMWAWSKGSEKC
jgi:L-ascorbate metabolism protein UlaG (beta-lactamase superfamily)